MLNNKTLDAAKPKEKAYKLTDRDGLYVYVSVSGGKSWRWNYSLNGKQKTKTYGTYPQLSIAEARACHLQFRDGLYRTEAKKPLFDAVKKDWLRLRLPELKNIKHQYQVQLRLDRYVSPHIGSKPIDKITRADLVEVVKKVQTDLNLIDTAHRVSTHIRQVFDYAVDMGLLEYHPAAGLGRVLVKPKVKNMACVPTSEAKQLFTDIFNYDEPMARYGLLLLASTFVRTNELRYMEWPEIKDGKFWIVPAERMKMKLPHVVPLSPFALKVLDRLEAITGGMRYVLHSPVNKDKPISENFFLDALYRMAYRGKMTGHGFRSLASTVLNENGFREDVIERQLAHKESDAVRAAYNRAEYLDERIKLMEWYGDWISNHLPSGETI